MDDNKKFWQRTTFLSLSKERKAMGSYRFFREYDRRSKEKKKTEGIHIMQEPDKAMSK